MELKVKIDESKFNFFLELMKSLNIVKSYEIIDEYKIESVDEEELKEIEEELKDKECFEFSGEKRRYEI